MPWYFESDLFVFAIATSKSEAQKHKNQNKKSDKFRQAMIVGQDPQGTGSRRHHKTQ